MSSPGRDRINVRTTPAFRARLERLAEERNTTLSGAIKSAVLETTKGDGGILSERRFWSC
jgi:hypothetical protein